MTPLETLSITQCLISQRDFDFFSCSQNLFKLKHLEIRGMILYALDLMPLRVLLEKVADTLEILDFQWCRMKDSQKMPSYLPSVNALSSTRSTSTAMTSPCPP
ncbi:expressed sequence AA792892, isoform CRA_c [Mus musculus]|nr:expressed sequence AA792892, isoform CRA_c [Mus musculus]